MNRLSKVALAATAVVAVGAGAYVNFMGMPAATPPLADLPIGQPAPAFTAKDADGREVTLASFPGKTVVLEWNNPDCPTVKEHYDKGDMQKTQAAAAADGVVWLTVNSSGPWKQGHIDGNQAKAYVAEQKAQPTAYLLDPEGSLGKAYGARATPNLYIVDASGKLAYRGAMRGGMDSAEAEAAGDRNHVLAALGELKAGKPVSVPMTRAYGCAVKYS